MVTEVAKITESRKASREQTGMEFRSAIALEQIADTLEAMRADAVGFQLALLRVLQTPKQ